MAYDAPSAEGADERSSDGGTSMSDNATFLEGLYGSFAQGDVPKVLTTMDPEIEWNEAEHVTFWTGKPFVGPDAVVQGVFARIGETLAIPSGSRSAGYSTVGQP